MPKPEQELEDLFRRSLPGVGVAAEEPLVAALAAYIRLLHKWNQAFNLTSVREPREMAIRHVLDALTARPFLHGGRILDVGTGAGLPGIPLALAGPDRQFCLLDSGGKKVRFVRQAMLELKLANVTAEHKRIEDFAPMQPFDTVISRAFSALADFAALAGRLVAPGGRLVAMKGRHPAEEIAALPATAPGWAVDRITPVAAPGLEGARHIVVLVREGAS